MASTLANGSFEDLDMDIDALLREHQQQRNSRVPLDRPRGYDIHRSGSAPPTVEGPVGALGSLRGNPDMVDGGGLLTEEEIRSHPAYLAYYYSADNLNPRLPPPMMSREDWRAAQMLLPGAPSFGGIGDQRKRSMHNGDGSSLSLFSQPAVSVPKQDAQSMELLRSGQQDMARRASAEWVERGGDGLTGLTGISLGARKKSFADALQEEMCQSTTLSGHPPRSFSYNGLDNGASDAELMQLQNSLETGNLRTSAASPGLVRVQSFGSSVSQSLASGLGPSLVRSTTPDPQLMRRAPSSCLPPIAGRGEFSSNGLSSCIRDNGDISAALAGMNLSKTRLVSEENHADNPLHNELVDQAEFLFNMHNNNKHYVHKNANKSESELLNMPSVPMMAYKDSLKKTGHPDHNISKLSANGRQGHLPQRSSFNGISTKMPPLSFAALEGSSSPYHKGELPDIDFTGSNMKGLAVDQILPERLNNQIAAGASFGGGIEEQNLSRSGSPGGSGFRASHVDPLYAQYLQKTDLAAQTASTLNDFALRRNYADTAIMDMPAYQKAYVEALLAQQKLQYGMPFLGKSIGYDQGHYGSAAYGLGMPYPPSPVTNSFLSSMGPGNSVRQDGRLSRFPSVGRNITGALGSWTSENGIKETGFTSSFLEEFKNNKTRSYELSDILDHVVEFSADQFGSRFIQQKLETTSVEEKNKIFLEILPHARALMTDVFGNYVIQKFFEHGTEDQRIQLASQLKGHVMALSLQMYGCRVIQKALEVVDVDQQTQMVSELDGSIMKCVRDQNGNHVIQKCIECVPQEKIQFIISTFYGQVVALSTHPYGCRVIQRVLEHCDDVKTQTIVMDEILQSVCTLAQDQYGNYVVQHVLQHGKPEERSAIISTLAGQIVKMSQQKFASNVVEKCLTFGSAAERQLLINEMLGSTDENEPLQAMMKDQFGNYVVQKVLETCDDQNRELILSRIKVHLNALKRYTYGKHIVARVEKLVAAGERHIGMSSCS